MYGDKYNTRYKTEYTTWSSMKARCGNKRHHAYKRYGGRGIKVCDRWKDFRFFLEDMGLRPAGMTLDRIDNDGDYSKENCRWATMREQCNNRVSNIPVSINGVSISFMEFSEMLSIPPKTLNWRIFKKKLPLHLALTNPVGRWK